jgi:predicted nucleotidyltransferase
MTVPHQFDTSLWEEALTERAKKREEHRQQLLDITKEKLYGYFRDKKVEAVYLTGSLLRAGQFYEFSDIDIAVEGLKEPYFQILRELEEILDRPVDIVELEDCRFRQSIETQGIKIR